MLFLAGYLSSCVLGRSVSPTSGILDTHLIFCLSNLSTSSFSGPLADKYGRRTMGQVGLVPLNLSLL